MKITYLGHSCFCLESEAGVKVITDPYAKVGYELPKGLQADIVTVSHGHFDHNNTAAVSGAQVVTQAGECVHCGVNILGKHTWHDPKQGALRGGNVIFRILLDGMDICHFGDLGEEYSEELAEFIKGADVWLIPVGGTYTIDAKQAMEYVEKVNPKIVIPMHYRPLDGGLDIAPIAQFLQYADRAHVTHRPNGEYVLTKESLIEGQTKIVYMERK